MICEFCGGTFVPSNRHAQQKFCCLAHYAAARKASRPTQQCALCGKDFPQAKPSQRHRKKFCSKACAYKAHRRDIAAMLAERAGTPGCWEWPFSKSEDGYGQCMLHGRKCRVPREAFEIANGVTVPPEKQVLHTCDNPPCFNPAHLFVGTNQDNVDDKLAKGRQPRGEWHCRAVLTEEQVRNIRTNADDAMRLAERYGVTRSTIYAIRGHKTWRHL